MKKDLENNQALFVYLKLVTESGVPIQIPSLPRYSFFCPSMMNCTLLTEEKEQAVYTTCIN